jgi:hypothetical protein
MAIMEDIAFVGQLLDAYADVAWKMGVAAEDREDAGVPPEMQVGEVNAEGWVEWRMLPSTLQESDVAEVETEFGVRFPPLFRAYLLARFHLFDQVRSRRYDQQVLMTDTPAGRPLTPIRELISAWRPLIEAGFVPIARWGDGWGPVCFDTVQRGTDDDCPIVWMDYEVLIPPGKEKCRRRESVLPLVQPLYASCREFLMDVFGHASREDSSGGDPRR